VEPVGHAPTGDHEGEGKKGGIRLCRSRTPLVLRDLTPRLRLVGCSLRVVGRLLQDVGRIPRDVSEIRQEVGSSVFSIHSFFFPVEERNRCSTAPQGISRILFSSLTTEGKE
jgi:hypothetical protein